MKIGILGTRGIPNAYGGFEQFAQHLAEGLVEKGHEIWVYSSSDHPYTLNQWKGINIVHCKDPENKIGTAGQFIYDLNCLKDARKRKFDILLQLGYTSNSIWFSLWPKNSINIVNMDGLEWKRSKYNKPTQKFLKLAEKWAAMRGDILIADSLGIQEHLRLQYQKSSTYIPYGATIFENPDDSFLKEWKLASDRYFLLIARMEPENNVETIIKGYLLSRQEYPLVLVGNTHNQFGKKLRKNYESPSIIFTGGIYEPEKINNIRYFSTIYFHGHSVGGTNPSLLEAMACSCRIAAHDNPFNRAILDDSAFYFRSAEDIANLMNDSNRNVETAENFKKRNLEKIMQLYNWPTIVDSYEKVFLKAMHK